MAGNSGSSGRIPGPYVHDVKQDDSLMEYVKFETMGIGARRSGLPNEVSEGPMRIEHVGGDQGKSGKGKHQRGGF